MESHIKASLISLMSAIKTTDGQTIANETARLDEFLERGRAGLPPRLAHLLQSRSYAKALAFLDGDADAAAGTCNCRRSDRV